MALSHLEQMLVASNPEARFLTMTDLMMGILQVWDKKYNRLMICPGKSAIQNLQNYPDTVRIQFCDVIANRATLTDYIFTTDPVLCVDGSYRDFSPVCIAINANNLFIPLVMMCCSSSPYSFKQLFIEDEAWMHTYSSVAQWLGELCDGDPFI